MKRTCVIMPENLLGMVKAAARRRGQTYSDFMRKIATEAVQRNDYAGTILDPDWKGFEGEPRGPVTENPDDTLYGPRKRSRRGGRR